MEKKITLGHDSEMPVGKIILDEEIVDMLLADPLKYRIGMEFMSNHKADGKYENVKIFKFALVDVTKNDTNTDK